MIAQLLTVAEAWASASAASGDHAVSFTQLLYPAINFVIFLFLLKRYLIPFATNYLRSRRGQIVEAVQGAAADRRSAEEMVRDRRAQLDRIGETVHNIVETLRGDGEREKARLIADAEELAGRIKADADFLAEQELKATRQQLRYEIARFARESAEKVLRSRITSSDQERLIGEFLVQVGEGR